MSDEHWQRSSFVEHGVNLPFEAADIVEDAVPVGLRVLLGQPERGLDPAGPGVGAPKPILSDVKQASDRP